MHHRRHLIQVASLVAMTPVLALPAGCAVFDGKTEHIISMENKGKEELYDVQILYGSVRFPPEPRAVLRGSRAYNDRFLVPEEAMVLWRIGNQPHRVVVPIRRHMPDAGSFEGVVEFRLNGSTLQVYVARPAPGAGYQRQQIY